MGYVDYFRQLAIRHKDIRHNPDSEDGDAKDANGKVLKCAKKFMRISAQEVLAALPSDAGFPLMPLELYDNTTRSETQIDVTGQYRGAFMVLKTAGINNFSEQQSAFADCERIVHEILQQIWTHHYGPQTKRCETPFSYFDFNNLEILFVSGIFSGNVFGVRVEFGFQFNQTSMIAKVPDEGTFID